MCLKRSSPSAGCTAQTLASFAACLLLLASCAVPVLPSGGPADQDPPELISTTPADGSVSQSVEQVVFEFDERIDEASARRAVSVVPEFDLPLRIRARGARLTVSFPERLRENTTYIVTLDNQLRDAHGVVLNRPLTLAFGTGPTINRGTLEGRVVAASDGTPSSGVEVFAYSLSGEARPALDERPEYRTQADDQGHFLFTYLREQAYFVLAVRDVNGNRKYDAGEQIAVPPVRAIRADTTDSTLQRSWILSRLDLTGPRVIEARARSAREIELRFSEAVVVRDTSGAGWIVADSLSNTLRHVEFMYAGDGPGDVVLRTEALAGGRHYVSGTAAVDDSSRNAMLPDTVYFSISDAPFSPESAFLGFTPDSLAATSTGEYRLWPGVQAGVRFSSPPGSAWSRTISVSDTLGTALNVTPTTSNGRLFHLFGAEIGTAARVEVVSNDSTTSRVFFPVSESATGDLSGVVAVDSTERNIVVELYAEADRNAPSYRTRPGPDGRFVFTGLPGGGTFLLRAFVDGNDDGRWNAGSLEPFTPAEPIGWTLVQEPVRPRWETVVPDTLNIFK